MGILHVRSEITNSSHPFHGLAGRWATYIDGLKIPVTLESVGRSGHVPTFASIHTGTQISCISHEIYGAIEFPTIDVQDYPDGTQLVLHAMHLVIPELGFADGLAVQVGEIPEDDIDIVLGRDVLQKLTLTYYGHEGAFTLVYPSNEEP